MYNVIMLHFMPVVFGFSLPMTYDSHINSVKFRYYSVFFLFSHWALFLIVSFVLFSLFVYASSIYYFTYCYNHLCDLDMFGL